MEDYRVVHNNSEQDSIDIRENFDKLLMGEIVVIPITHGSSGGTDSFPAWFDNVASINAVSDNEDMTSPYTSGVDYVAYVANDDSIDWSPGGSEPAVGQVYYVSINWTKTYTVNATSKVDGNTEVLTVGGFNPETDIRDELAKYPKSGDTRVKQEIDKMTALSQMVIYPIRNTASPFGELSFLNQETEDYLKFDWNSFLHKIVGVAQTGTATNYARLTINDKDDGLFEYMDDFAEATKWTFDRFFQNGVSHSGSQLNFGATAVLIYKIELPFQVKKMTVTANFGTNCEITFMTEETYDTNYDAAGNLTNGVEFEVHERVFFIKVSINSSYVSDIKFDCHLKSAGCTLPLQIGTNTIEFGMPTNSQLDVDFVHEERSLRLEEEANKGNIHRLNLRLRELEEQLLQFAQEHRYPIGSIRMYDGTKIKYAATRTAEIGLQNEDEIHLKGWYVCNGNSGTPDLKDKFVRSESASGNAGGNDDISIGRANLPTDHEHGLGLTITASAGTSIGTTNRLYPLNTTTYPDANAAGTLIDNRPEFYSLIFIIKMS